VSDDILLGHINLKVNELNSAIANAASVGIEVDIAVTQLPKVIGQISIVQKFINLEVWRKLQ
jgi:hypothetical protein